MHVNTILLLSDRNLNPELQLYSCSLKSPTHARHCLHITGTSHIHRNSIKKMYKNTQHFFCYNFTVYQGAQ